MARRLKIAQIITRLDRGGSSDVVVALCERLDAQRFDVTLITGPSDNPVEEPQALAERVGITVAECPHLTRPICPVKDLRALLSLRSYLDELEPDVVHVHTSKAGAIGRMAARLAGGVPTVYSPHGHLFYGYYGKLGTGLVVFAERLLAPLADTIAVLTDTSRAEHLGRGIGRFEQFVTVPSGIDLKRFTRDDDARQRIRAELNLDNDQFVIGWVGRLTPVKGPDVFIEVCGLVAQRLADASFVIVGDGELRAEAERRAEALAVRDRCTFLGQRDDVPAILNACDVFVLSSRNEGLGLAVVEAMACGTPVVATDVGGVREVLDNGRAGRLFGGDVRALADGIIELANDEAQREELARAGLARAGDFNVERMADAFAELYEELASGCSA